ncbi:BURP domain-containing protein BNM2A-like [Chenopodium quinoa]|uniref:BURP domain-containing protein BNM2A-like n=1 Tax=Chenopodium quinoa TaxID=63459 RepID=UPI000B78452D|nr:BURP domain-containing protein BNM2A-like [Chenopodium quinoa]
MLLKSSLALYMFLQMAMLVNANTEKSLDQMMEDINQVFIHYNNLNKVGLNIPIYFGGAFSSQIPRFLPKEKADLMPFSSLDLPFLLRVFGFAPGSPQARAMDNTLKMCGMKMHHETKKCVSSLESMLDFIRETFNSNSSISSNSNSNSNSDKK